MIIEEMGLLSAVHLQKAKGGVKVKMELLLAMEALHFDF